MQILKQLPKMKIALIGYGKMGHAIEAEAIKRGHEIVAIIDADNIADIDSDAFRSADVAIEFTSPHAAFDNYLRAFAQGVKVVSGSTGWTERIDEIKQLCRQKGYTFFWTSNFSIGVNIFFALSRYLAKIMKNFPQYTPELSETHHVHKLDHPSGTAISLAQGIIEESGRITAWSEQPVDEKTLIVNHIRRSEVPGIHTITWDSPVDEIVISHSAKSRAGFALGAVIAAEWVATQQGFLTMDMLMERIINNSSQS